MARLPANSGGKAEDVAARTVVVTDLTDKRRSEAMAFHVPFSQRASGRGNPTASNPYQPVYIGFNEPTSRPRKKFNWWGFNGLFLFFLSLGILSPVTLLVSMMGLRRRPRKMAVAGTLFSLAGVGVMSAIALAGYAEHREHQQQRAERQYQRSIATQVRQTEKTILHAVVDVEDARDDSSGVLPADIDGNLIVIEHTDAWDTMLRYETEDDHSIIRSAGPDRKFDTRDDLTSRVDGQPNEQPLLPVDY